LIQTGRTTMAFFAMNYSDTKPDARIYNIPVHCTHGHRRQGRLLQLCHGCYISVTLISCLHAVGRFSPRSGAADRLPFAALRSDQVTILLVDLQARSGAWTCPWVTGSDSACNAVCRWHRVHTHYTWLSPSCKHNSIQLLTRRVEECRPLWIV